MTPRTCALAVPVVVAALVAACTATTSGTSMPQGTAPAVTKDAAIASVEA